MAKPDLTSLSLDELNDLIAEATKLRDARIEQKRAELLKELAQLDTLAGKSVKPAASRSRASPKATHRSPSGDEWSGRGGIPRWAKDLGVTDKAGMEKYRITD